MEFAFPWVLGALAVLPALWWLLKALPPPPKVVTFPALRLLRGLEAVNQAAARMPWVLLVIRLALLTSLILAAAGPAMVGKNQTAKTTGPLLLAFDDGWAAASDWQARQDWMINWLNGAKQQGRSVYLIPTALPFATQPELMNAQQAIAALQTWQPKPWATDYRAAMAALRHLPMSSNLEIIWVSDGLADDFSPDWLRGLAQLGNGPLVVMGQSGAVLRPVSDQNDLTFDVQSLSASMPMTVVGLDQAGHELGRAPVEQGRAVLALPLVLRNQIARVVVEGQHSAAATLLMDENSRIRTIGLVEDEATSNPLPLLDSLTYVEKAMHPFAQIQRGTLAEVLAAKPAMVMIGSSLDAATVQSLQSWIQAGGMVIRFAHSQMSENSEDVLIPSGLRRGGRELGGMLSWTKPQHLADFSPDSPFADLPNAPDVEVQKQVLADPDLSKDAKVWARLADGTPLVTAKAMGRGWLVLFHVAAIPTWSSLPLSGLFPQMLHNLVSLSSSSGGIAVGALPPLALLDGFGVLHPPGEQAAAMSGQMPFGPNHAPGFYGIKGAPVAFNLGPSLKPLARLDVPDGIQKTGLQDRPMQQDLRPLLLLLALLLALMDVILTRRVLLVVLLLFAGHAQAGDLGEPSLAYVLTGNRSIDQKSQAGLQNLTTVLAARSTASLASPQGVNPDSENLAFYPLLYWPINSNIPEPGPLAAKRIKEYLKHGGLIVFDRQDGGGPDAAMDAVLRRLNGALDLPVLRPLPVDHVLTRSFFLIKSMPGRFTTGTVWIQGNNGDNDGVATVILGSNDWAGQWAGFGDDGQMEAALRFGINLCIYALTGNYKTDQVHMPAILERLGQKP